MFQRTKLPGTLSVQEEPSTRRSRRILQAPERNYERTAVITTVDPAPTCAGSTHGLHGRPDDREATWIPRIDCISSLKGAGQLLVTSSTYLKGSLREQFHPLLQSPSRIKLEFESRRVVAELQGVISEEYFRKLDAFQIKRRGCHGHRSIG